MVFRSGIPSLSDYREALESPVFHGLERFSDEFLRRHREALADYSRRWVADPLHQWSRQWEYPFVERRMRRGERDTVPVTILDAGSGATFFPWLLARSDPPSRIVCVDSDAALRDAYQAIAQSEPRPVDFVLGDLRDLPLPDGSADVIYCLSVLEHTNDYPRIVREFLRVLKPAGQLLVTFDLSWDGRCEIDIATARELMGVINHHFVAEDPESETMTVEKTGQKRFTTRHAARMRPSLIPWPRPGVRQRIKSLLRLSPLPPWPPLMSVYCCVYRKRAGGES